MVCTDQQAQQDPPCLQAAHPSLQQSRDLQMFLEASEDDFAHEVARAQVGNRLSITQAGNLPKQIRMQSRCVGHSL